MFSFSFSKKKDIVGIDIGSSSIKLVQLKEQKGIYSLEKLGLLPLPPEAIVDNTLMDSTTIAETLKTLVGNLGIKAREAASSVSGHSVIIRKISLPAMTPEELEDQIHWEAEQYIPFDINDVHVDFQILQPDDFDSSRMNVLLVASKKDIVNDYLAVFNEAGFKLVVVDVDAFAVQNVFEANYTIDPEEVVALINIGSGIMNLNIIKNGYSLFTRDVQMGGNLYTEELQKQFAVSVDEAERMKITGQSPDEEKFRQSLARINETVSLEVRRSLDFYNSTAGEGKIEKIYLSGGGAKTDQLPEIIQQRLSIPVEVMNPFQKIRYNEKDHDAEYLQSVAPIVTVAIGLAMRRVGDK